ncbi:MAG: 2-C-methyl-D-erythritol 4-phosphate cytidylyltransferase [Pseudomonadota bacterium]|nr:MAG: 2-C-methyl-D-erythritol 4-phosphate cytidylyltransferase [Pseudomonadota bacterium]
MTTTAETSDSPLRCWAVVPAAGVGRRMGNDLPKQYLFIGDKPVIVHTLERLASEPSIAGIVVAVADSDEHWSQLEIDVAVPLLRAPGGQERCHSVLSALNVLHGTADDADPVLVHDAARPCVRPADLAALIGAIGNRKDGGLLATPVRDTMKRSDTDGRVARTVDREGLWHALTPQMFRLDLLRAALQQAITDGYLVTDEASAMEHAGYHPRLVESHGDNIKITHPQDLATAEFFLEQQRRQGIGLTVNGLEDGG